VKLIERFSQLDIVLGTHAVHRLPELIQSIEKQPAPIVATAMTEKIDETLPFDTLPPRPQEISGFVTIRRG
jgi:tRNA-2-methylthio-N6-dimethylallyladenosine synthase